MYTASNIACRRPDPGMSRSTQVNLPHTIAYSRQDSRRILIVTWLGSPGDCRLQNTGRR